MIQSLQTKQKFTLTQNYVLRFFNIINFNRDGLMLRQLASAMHWATKVQFDKIHGLAIHLGVRPSILNTGIAYLNIDLANMQKPGSSPVDYTHESISALPYQIHSQLKNFLIQLESEVVLNELAVAQLGKILQDYDCSDDILRDNHIGLSDLTDRRSSQYWIYDVYDILSYIHRFFRRLGSFDELAEQFVESLPVCLQPHTRERLLEKFAAAFDFFSDFEFKYKSLDLPNLVNDHVRNMVSSHTNPLIDAQTLEHFNFVFVFCQSLPAMREFQPTFDILSTRGFAFFRLNKARYISYCQLLEKSIRTFFSDSEWYSRGYADKYSFSSKESLTLTTFLAKLFDPSSKKVRILL